MAKYITLGFKTDAKARQFMSWVKSNGNLLNLAKRLPPKEGQEKGSIQITNIQASSVHEYVPRVLEHRLYEFAPVILEFREQPDAERFVSLLMELLRSETNRADEAEEVILELRRVAEAGGLAGIKYQREVGGI